MKTLLIGINSKYIHPAMGIYQIYANSNYPTFFYEFTIKDSNLKIIDFITKETFEILGFSVYIWNVNKIQEIIKQLPKSYSIVLGGPEVYYQVDNYLKFQNVRYIIKGEGEESLNKLISSLNNDSDITNVPNLYYRTKSSFKYTFDKKPNLNFIKNDLSLISDFKNRYAYLESSRGCCFSCSYCIASLEGNIRYFPMEKVKTEIQYLLSKEVKTIKFLDRSFNINQKRMRDIITYIINHDNGFTSYQFEINGELLDLETIKLLKTVRRGLIRFEIGIQSTNPKVLKAIRRSQDFLKIKSNIQKIRNNIITHLDLIAGLPYESHDSFIKTFNDTYLLFGDEIQLGFLKELKGTKISSEKEDHDYEFDLNAPYEVIENKYITNLQLREFHLIEKILNRYHNSQDFIKTINYLFKTKNKVPYDTYLKIANYLKEENISFLQHWQIAELLFKALQDDNDQELLFIIKQDYLLKYKIKPKIWWEPTINRAERLRIYRQFISLYPQLNENILYRYSQLEKYKNQYFLAVYKPYGFYYLNT